MKKVLLLALTAGCMALGQAASATPDNTAEQTVADTAVVFNDASATLTRGEETTGEELFAQMLAPYKGKVIYLDFWGTWCPGCLSQMYSVGDLKQALAGEEVIFMYVAMKSPEDKWRKYIGMFGLTGDNVVHYRLDSDQHKLLTHLLEMKTLPRYIIIDRQGNIALDKAPRPKEGEKTVAEIRSWINKGITAAEPEDEVIEGVSFEAVAVDGEGH